MKSYKKFCLNFFATIPLFGLGLLALCVLLWLYDPFMFFHKPYFREQTFMNDLRISARGIIDFTEFDSVILGSSVLANISSKEASEKIGNKWINLTLWGSTLKERSILLEYLFQKKQIKAMIYSIDAYTLLNHHSPSPEIDPLLYRDKLSFRVFKFYLNKNFIQCAIFWSKHEECIGQKDLETIASITRFLNNIGGIQKWKQGIKESILETYNLSQSIQTKSLYDKHKTTEQIQNEVEKYLFSFAQNYPQIKFYCLIPTHPRLFYKIPAMQGYYQGRTPNEFFVEWKQAIKWLIQKGSEYSNVKFYGFDDTNYPDNIANFGDFEHPNIDIHSMQLDAIANGTHILTPQNIDSYLATMESKIKSYDITPIIEQIKAWKAGQNPKTK